MINNELDFKYTKLKDKSKTTIIRPSGFTRILLGTFFTTSSCLIYSIIFTKLKKLDHSFIRNYLKGSFLLSFGFFSLNEFVFSTAKIFGLYSNFFLNYSITSYAMSRIFYKHLIRNHYMQWDKAIKYSHKCFLIFCVCISAMELIIYIYREVQLYDGEDFFDYFDKKLNKSNENTDDNGEPITFKDIESNFMSAFHIFNNPEKRKMIDQYVLEQSYIEDRNNNNNRRYKTVNLYQFFRDKYI